MIRKLLAVFILYNAFVLLFSAFIARPDLDIVPIILTGYIYTAVAFAAIGAIVWAVKQFDKTP